MAKKMPSPDTALKEFFDDNDVFAALFNAYFFDGRPVVDSAKLTHINTSYSEAIAVSDGIETVNKYRDIVRLFGSRRLSIQLGVEGQNKVHYAMPVRNMLYDSLSYAYQFKMQGKQQDSSKWTVDERLSGACNGTKIKPAVTIVFYTGEKPWNGPTSLYEMIAGIDEKDEFSGIIQDYKAFVVDIGHDEKLVFPNEQLNLLRSALTSIYSGRGDTDNTRYPAYILALSGILAGDEKLYRFSSKGGTLTMCEALKRRDEAIEAKYAKEMQALKKKNNEEIARLKKKNIEELNLFKEKSVEELKSLKKENEELKKKLSALQGTK